MFSLSLSRGKTKSTDSSISNLTGASGNSTIASCDEKSDKPLRCKLREFSKIGCLLR